MSKEPKIVPTDEEGKEVELDQESKLMNHSKKELVEIIKNNETKHKRALTEKRNLKKELEEAKKEIENLKDLVNDAELNQEQTMEEAASMSETLRTKNRVLNEVVETHLNLVNTIKSTANQGLKILEYNGLISNTTRRGE